MNRAASHDDKVYSIADLQREGTKRLPSNIGEYYNEGAMDLITLKDNTAAFDRLRLRARVAVDVSAIDASTQCFGVTSRFPLGFSPAAMHKLAHPDGEVGTSHAAGKAGVNMILSQYATASIEEVITAGEGSGNAYGFQVCLVDDWDANVQSIKRAEAAGCRALVVTVDVPYLGRRLNEHRNQFALPRHLTFPNLPDGVDVHGMVTTDPRVTYNKGVTWSLLKRIVEMTPMKVFLKGITTAEDAAFACEIGAAGVIVSTHGGRQLDGGLASIDALPAVVDAVAGRCEVHLDSGIRRGSDIFKALAIGADYCWVGRVPIWGLAYKGEAGVTLALNLLYDEFVTTMALSGCTSVKDINRACIARMRADGSFAPLPPRPKNLTPPSDPVVARL